MDNKETGGTSRYICRLEKELKSFQGQARWYLQSLANKVALCPLPQKRCKHLQYNGTCRLCGTDLGQSAREGCWQEAATKALKSKGEN